MLAAPMTPVTQALEPGLEGPPATTASDLSAKESSIREVPRKKTEERTLTLRPGYMYREANWEIGRAAERAGVKVKEFKPGDRFAAWRKTNERKARNAEKKGMKK